MSEDNHRDKDIKSLRRRLKEERANLRLIQEGMSQFALITDIPLSLVKEEQTKAMLIAQLESELKETANTIVSPATTTAPTSEARLSPSEPVLGNDPSNRLLGTLRDPAWQGVAALIGVAALLVAVGAWLLPAAGWSSHQILTPTATSSLPAIHALAPIAVGSPKATHALGPIATSTATATSTITASPSPTDVPTPTPMGRQPINVETAARISLIQPPLVENMGSIYAIAYANDGTLYATGLTTQTNQPWLWEVAPTTTPVVLNGESYDRAGVAFSRDGQKLAWGIGDGDRVAIWNTEVITAPRIIRPWDANDQRFTGAIVLSLAFSADGLTLACGTNKGAIALVRLDDAVQPDGLFYEPGHFVEVVSVAFASGDGASGLSLATVLGWRIRQWTIQPGTTQLVSWRNISPELRGTSSLPSVLNPAFSPKDDLLAAVGQPRGGLQIWNTDRWGMGRWLAGGIDTSGRIQRPTLAGQLPDSYPNGVPRGDNVRFSPDGSIVTSWIRDWVRIRGDVDGVERHMIRLWQVSDGQILANTEPLSSGIPSLAFSPDGATLAAGALDGTIYQWRVQ